MVIIADTDVFIAAIRGNEIAQSLLRKYGGSIAVSAITAAELYVGAKNHAKKKIVEQILNDHELIELNKAITEVAIRLIKTYNTSTKQLLVADAFIAATCLENKAALLTFNTKDFRFIKGLRLAK